MAIRLALALPLLLAACDPAALDDGFDTVDQEGKEDGVQRPVGTFVADGVAPGQFSLLVLESDRTFYREMVVACFTTPCPPIAQQGRYVFTSSGHIRYIRFQDLDGVVIDKFAYVLSGDSLELRKTYTSVWFQMERESQAECTTASDCAMQQIEPAECDGEWICSDGACEYQCDAVEPVGCENVTPGDGGEGEPCASTDDCDGQQYCNPTRCVCYPPRECVEASDCDDPTNLWSHDSCPGSATCAAGLCEWVCG